MMEFRRVDAVYFLSGLAVGVGFLVLPIYFILKRKDSGRFLSLLFYIVPVGGLLAYAIGRKDEREISMAGLWTTVGFAVSMLVLTLLGINPFITTFLLIHGWMGE